MLDQILDIVKDNAKDLIENNGDIDNQYNESAISEAASTISNGFKDKLQSGNVKDVLDVFSEKTSNTDNPLVNQLSSMFGSQLGNKFNVSGDKANGIAGQLIPMVIDQLVKKVNDSNDSSIDLNGLLGSLSGQQGVNFGDLMQKFNNGDSDGFGLDDAMDLLKGKGGSALGGLFGK